MKTTEELRKELEQLRREEFDACLDFSHKIKPLEEQLKAAEKGDLLFGDVQFQSKLAYINDLLSNRGISLFVDRVSDSVEFAYKGEKLNAYKQLALFYQRSQDQGFSILYTFDVVETGGELLVQLNLVEQQLDLLQFLCKLNSRKDFPPYFTGTLGTEISMFYYDLGGFPVIDTSLVISYDKVTDRYTVKLENQVEWFCEDDVEVPSDKFKEVKTTVHFKDVESLKLIVSKEGVRSSDLKTALEELKARLLELNEKDKDKVTVQVTLVTE
jgi:hypothetical protein